ncbi:MULTISPECIES: M67 family metallopeptidase [Pacificimonas]|nr:MULTISPECIES: M67 family metallopeptidase [Pacificimonas]
MTWQITSIAAESIRSHERRVHPEEACGLLFGGDRRIEEAVPAPNVSPTPRHRFEIDPKALFSALRAERQGGPRLLGYYHSHPSGTFDPSETDAKLAQPDGRLWLIAAEGRIAGFIAGNTGIHGRFQPIALDED